MPRFYCWNAIADAGYAGRPDTWQNRALVTREVTVGCDQLCRSVWDDMITLRVQRSPIAVGGACDSCVAADLRGANSCESSLI